MFTGIVEEQGTVCAVQRTVDVLRVDIDARATLEGSELGASVAVNGAAAPRAIARRSASAIDLIAWASATPARSLPRQMGRLKPTMAIQPRPSVIV